MKQRSVVFKAPGHPARLAMVERIALGECCVWELIKFKELAPSHLMASLIAYSRFWGSS